MNTKPGASLKHTKTTTVENICFTYFEIHVAVLCCFFQFLTFVCVFRYLLYLFLSFFIFLYLFISFLSFMFKKCQKRKKDNK